MRIRIQLCQLSLGKAGCADNDRGVRAGQLGQMIERSLWSCEIDHNIHLGEMGLDVGRQGQAQAPEPGQFAGVRTGQRGTRRYGGRLEPGLTVGVNRLHQGTPHASSRTGYRNVKHGCPRSLSLAKGYPFSTLRLKSDVHKWWG